MCLSNHTDSKVELPGKTPCLAAAHAQTADLKVPESKRIPFGWTAAGIGPGSGESLTLYWNGPLRNHPAWLRIAIALDVRENVRLALRSAATGVPIGEFDIRYASVFQLYQVKLTGAQTELVLKEGAVLSLIQGSEALWIFTGGPAEAPLLLPHLLPESADSPDPWLQLPGNLASLSSVQAFGWQEGCVLDGLLELERAAGTGRFLGSVKAHLGMFFDQHGNLRYENPRSEPADGRVYGIEGTLPFAALAQVDPAHPSMERAIRFWLSDASDDGTIRDGTMLSAEGSYTIAYPMAVMAKAYDRHDLALLAIRQLEARQKLLTDGDVLYLRSHEDGSRSFRNWSRAYAWYLLGLARTLRELQEFSSLPDADYNRIAALKSELARAAGVIMTYQSPAGLWPVYVDEPETGIETSGSAAIAAALAIGVQLGVLDDQAGLAALRTRNALTDYLTPDGILYGVAQNNKDDGRLQREGYRILSQMGTGLAAQLEAVLQQLPGLPGIRL
ncbi:glycoside hydrolase family 88 protein [Paenibacillus gansuensis]|uniref:Glycoside hydrolase family 88 protein n=1 Tax=Paenibacillus gansuensis TaxID=306542 RepID=A0ABW5PLV0_9BACL